ncbi:nucleolar complex protein 2-like protein [Pyrus ussuriensis x Pyrus communis]|uniref:Nucleolar complex protein 2-like protein n=1 Tax=Pyrus ussuriensis x Pyrus communis TaxID=2448454 RepID=A0A5N5FWD4_9ROSA|nr:nucleolar complex protein 2-like protein [Pyrus ussuriensis x Pyrus communis]
MGIWINETVFFFLVTIEGRRLAGAAVVKFQELEFVILKLLIMLPTESYYVRCSAQGPVVNAGVSREDPCRLVHFVAYRTFVPLVGSCCVSAHQLPDEREFPHQAAEAPPGRRRYQQAPRDVVEVLSES